MAVTQNELISALQTLLSTNPVRLAMRSGTAASLNLADLVVGEIAVATDTLQVWVCTALGTVIPLTGLNLLGYYSTSGTLASAHPTGTAGQVYVVGSAPAHLYTWGTASWVDLGAMNDVSTFATLASPTFTGTVTLPNTTVPAGKKLTLTDAPAANTDAANKSYVDQNINFVRSDGWNAVSETWAFATASTITVPGGATTRFYKGGRIKFTQSGVVKKGVLLNVTSTLLTILVNIDFLLTNVAITDIYYSDQQSPAGYPHWFNIAAPTWNVSTGMDNGAGGQPTTVKHIVKVDGNTLEGFILASGTKASTSWYIGFTMPYAIAPVNSYCIGSSNVGWSGNDKGGMCTLASGMIYCISDTSLTIADNQVLSAVSVMFKLIF